MIRPKRWKAIVRGILATRKPSQAPTHIIAALSGWYDVEEFQCQDEACRVTIRGDAHIWDWHCGHRIAGHRKKKNLSAVKDVLKHRDNPDYLRKYFYLAHGHCNLFRARNEADRTSLLDPRLKEIKRQARRGFTRKRVFRELKLKQICTYANFCVYIRRKGIVFKKRL